MLLFSTGDSRGAVTTLPRSQVIQHGVAKVANDTVSIYDGTS